MLKDRLKELVPTVFHKEEWRTQIQMPCLRKGYILFCKQKHSGSTKKYSETDDMNMLEFLIENIFVMFGGRVFQQTVGLRVLPVLPFSVTRSFIPTRLHTGTSEEKGKEASRSFNFILYYIDPALLLNNSTFGEFVNCYVVAVSDMSTDTFRFS